jgi:hypothetical protein
MGLITFKLQSTATEADFMAVIRQTIDPTRPVTMAYNADQGILYFVDLPDATAAETNKVRNDLRVAFPAETAG